MRRLVRTFVTLLMTTAAYDQAPDPELKSPPTDATTSIENQKTLDKLLAIWETQNVGLKSVEFGFTRIDKSRAWNEKIEYRGRAYLNRPNLTCLQFQKMEETAGEKPKLVEYERIVCTGKELIQYDYETKQVFFFPLQVTETKPSLLQAWFAAYAPQKRFEPPLLLFNLKATEAKARFDLTLLDQKADGYLIAIIPRQLDDQLFFSKVLIQVNKETCLPVRLMLFSPNGKDTQDYRFSEIKANTEINPQFFQAIRIKGWRLIGGSAPVTP